MTELDRVVFHGSYLPALLGKTALARSPDPALADEAGLDGVVMLQFDDVGLPQAFGWWPFLRSSVTFYPPPAGAVVDVARVPAGARGVTRRTLTPAPDRPDLAALIGRAKAAFAALPPDEQESILREQRESWVRGNLAIDRGEGARRTVSGQPPRDGDAERLDPLSGILPPLGDRWDYKGVDPAWIILYRWLKEYGHDVDVVTLFVRSDGILHPLARAINASRDAALRAAQAEVERLTAALERYLDGMAAIWPTLGDVDQKEAARRTIEDARRIMRGGEGG